MRAESKGIFISPLADFSFDYQLKAIISSKATSGKARPSA